MEYITGLVIAWITEHFFGVAVTTIGSGLLGLILKKYVKKDDLENKVDQWLEDHKSGYRKFWRVLLRGCSLNVTRWPVIGSIWNAIVEPLFIIGWKLLGKVGVWAVTNAVDAGVIGLLSDNPNYAGETKTDAKKAARDEVDPT